MINHTSTLLTLQRRQHQHDMNYHPDILALSTIDRLKHFTLHNTKYAAKFAGYEIEGNEDKFSQVLTDSFVIVLATANTLLQRLEISPSDGDTIDNGPIPFTFAYLKRIGQMAKACESIDHLEDFPFRKVLVTTNQELANQIASEAMRRDLSLEALYAERISAVEASSGYAIFETPEA